MTGRKRLKIGTSDYRKLIEDNGYFVDKTLFIKEIIDSAHEVMLIPRPRRFGKTLNLSMLRYFFDAAQPDTAQLFEPYLIWQAEEYYTAQQGKYPVIHLPLKAEVPPGYWRNYCIRVSLPLTVLMAERKKSRFTAWWMNIRFST